MQARHANLDKGVKPRGTIFRPRLSLMQLWNMCCGLFGVQIVWGLQNANTSRIFQTLGANIDELPMLWIAAPVTGLLVQPIVGHLSDRTWGPMGRRRPYILGGAVLSAVALLAMPNAPTLLSASLILWMLTASINIAMEPFRAFVADTLPEEQRTAGFATQVFFIGMGAVLASALPWILVHWFGVSDTVEPGVLPRSVRVTFYIGAIALLATVAWTVFTTSERPPENFTADIREAMKVDVLRGPTNVSLVRGGAIWVTGGTVSALVAAFQGYEREINVLAGLAIAFGVAQFAAAWRRNSTETAHNTPGLLGIIDDILVMPIVLKRLAVVQFFTWFGMFTMWIYMVPAVAARYFGATDTASAAYNAGADWVGILFAGYNGVAAVVALALPIVVKRIGRRASHGLCLIFGGIGLLGFLIIESPLLLWVPMLGIGCAWASILSTPYAMLASAVPPTKMGVYMGIHNIFLVLPQLVAAATLGAVVEHAFGGRAIFALVLSAIALFLAAVFSWAISDAPPQHTNA